jgi:simple sugar transport system ATP-binding protein
MASEGHSLIFISHKLHEVLSFSDRVTVLRNGRVVRTLNTADTNRNELARLMVGREVLLRVDHPAVEVGAPRLEVRDLHALGDGGLPAVRGATLEVRAGEILGLAGVSGNGQRELAEAIAGLRKITQGSVHIDGENIAGKSPKQIIDKGLAYISEERFRDGVVKELSVEENLMLEVHGEEEFTHGIFMDFPRIAAHTDKLIANYDIKTPSRQTPSRNLSGGNVQKLIMARELSRQPRVLIASQPTRGVDIGSTEYIHQRLIAQRERQTATLLISEDLDEILNLSDRIAVMFEGRIMGVLSRAEATVEQLGLLMAGVGGGESSPTATPENGV